MAVRTGIAVLFCLGFICPVALPGDSADPDEKLLREAKLGSGPKDLLDLVRRWSGRDDDLLAADALARKLGSDSFDERTDATEKLAALGPAVLPVLLPLVKSPDREAAKRAEDCVRRINEAQPTDVRRAAVLRLLRLRPAGTAEALLRFLPFAADEELAEEIQFALYDLAKADATFRTTLATSLTDRPALRRAAAACILGRLGTEEQRGAVRKLLNDPAPLVRLRAAQGLLAARDGMGIATLIELLDEPLVEISWQVEELLHWAAADDGPPEVIGTATAAERQKCRTAWRTFWEKRQERPDWEAVAKTYRRPGLLLVCTGQDTELRRPVPRAAFRGTVWLCGCNGRPRWCMPTTKVRDIQLLPRNRVLALQDGLEPVGDQSQEASICVTECSLNGKTLWQPELPDELHSPQALARLPAGYLLLTAEDGPWLSRDPKGSFRQVEEPGRDIRRHVVAGVPGAGVIKLCNGNIIGLEQYRIAECTPDGRLAWEAPLSYSPPWHYLLRDCLGLVRLGFDEQRPANFDLAMKVPYHAARLKHQDPLIRAHSIKALVQMGPAAASAIPALIDRWDDPDFGIACLAAESFRTFKADYLPHVLAALKDKRPRVRGFALDIVAYRLAGLYQWRTVDPKFEPATSREQLEQALLAATKDEAPFVRFHAIGWISMLGEGREDVQRALIGALKDHANPGFEGWSTVAERVAAHLGRLGPDADWAIPGLIEAAQSDDWAARQYSLGALKKMGLDAKRMVPLLAKTLAARAADGTIPARLAEARRTAIWILRDIEMTKEHIPWLARMLAGKDSEAELRRFAAANLLRMAEFAESATPALTVAAYDPDLEVRTLATQALEMVKRK